MGETVRQRVVRWDRELEEAAGDSRKPSTFARILDHITYFEEERYRQYLPALGTLPAFRDRLARWLDGVDEEDQKRLLPFVRKLFFVGVQEQHALYRAAFNGPILRWLIEVADIDITADGWGTNVDDAIRETWFCGISDSMQTNAFLKANQVEGVADGIALKSIRSILQEDDRILETIMQRRRRPLKYLVLLEDFVGSGLQMKPILRCAAALDRVQVLVVPLVCCKGGAKVGASFDGEHAHIRFEPVLVLPENAGLNRTTLPDEDPSFEEIRRITKALHAAGKVAKPPFGFDGDGPLYLSYTNCPNNAPPFLHDGSGTDWYPLFPRVSRTISP